MLPAPPPNSPPPLRVLVVDDEAPARQRLIDLLRRDSSVTAIHEASDGRLAVDAIRSVNPDLVFLDVQMPELDGLGVIEQVGAGRMPLTVLVTAFDQHAVAAFEANALDYLLKPFSDERFEAAMARVRTRLDERGLREFGEHVMRLISPPRLDAGPPLDRLVVKAGGATRFLATAAIEWIEGAGVYVTLHVGAREILHRVSLTELEARLDARLFIRVHRSAIINLEQVSHLEPASHGEFEVVMKSGARVKLSRTYRAQFEKRLGQPLR
ncbi:MAG: LytTR family transcriptional regulator DNA-binding domain-containing protein [Bryobacterales bacterium]|nr:LytTR family transcriptional regulator DNA-binding domain-containing protein [Bryobacterales bacterium]